MQSGTNHPTTTGDKATPEQQNVKKQQSRRRQKKENAKTKTKRTLIIKI